MAFKQQILIINTVLFIIGTEYCNYYQGYHMRHIWSARPYLELNDNLSSNKLIRTLDGIEFNYIKD